MAISLVQMDSQAWPFSASDMSTQTNFEISALFLLYYLRIPAPY